uniref:Uncharacterized protein n=1 Tax=Opuntia streptacantha TaxID=393608 RepID=A0A7C9DYC9_OPUST
MIYILITFLLCFLFVFLFLLLLQLPALQCITICGSNGIIAILGFLLLALSHISIRDFIQIHVIIFLLGNFNGCLHDINILLRRNSLVIEIKSLLYLFTKLFTKHSSTFL